MASSPSLATIKRLFAVSSNRCAFPKCGEQLVESTSGKVIGRVCHIKARSPDGPRYDPSQSSEERHGFENLILMCPKHHDVIDADEESYTVERLVSLKEKHEEASGQPTTLDDTAALSFVSNIIANTVSQGSIIISNNQMGGQVAHSIHNYGPVPRTIAPLAVRNLSNMLSQLRNETVTIVALWGDSEAHSFAHELARVFRICGWRVTDIAQAAFSAPVKGVIVKVPLVDHSAHILGNWLLSCGLESHGEVVQGIPHKEIIVGANK